MRLYAVIVIIKTALAFGLFLAFDLPEERYLIQSFMELFALMSLVSLCAYLWTTNLLPNIDKERLYKFFELGNVTFWTVLGVLLNLEEIIAAFKFAVRQVNEPLLGPQWEFYPLAGPYPHRTLAIYIAAAVLWIIVTWEGGIVYENSPVADTDADQPRPIRRGSGPSLPDLDDE
jgi:hypothetical protein